MCRICRGVPNEGFVTCFSCNQSVRQVSRPCRTVVPFSFYKTYSQLHSVLRWYKDHADPRIRERFSLQVAAFLGIALVRHGDCLRRRAGPWDTLTTVPSTSGQRSGPHPLAQTIRRVQALADRCDDLLVPGPVKIDHNRADDQGFVVTKPVEERPVIVVDDTYTSGARVQSAASALQLAGGIVPAIVVVGRVVNPAWSPATAQMWERQTSLGFDFGRCALEDESASDDGWVEIF